MTTRYAIFLALALGLVFGAISPATADDPPSPVVQKDDKYSDEELSEIVGPIALYPDVVLNSLLPASTVPTDVVKAARWVEKQDGDITAAPEDSGWDASVDAMIQFPDVLTWMNDNLDWLEQLGYAVSVQQGDVLASIQAFRAEAKEAGNLESNDKVEVVVTNENVIEVQPADPQVVYVPQYQPQQVVYANSGSSAGTFWTGFAAGALGAWAWNTIRWGGGGGSWGGGSINVNNSPSFNFNNNGNINRGNVGSGNRWNAPRGKNTGRPANRPRGGVQNPRPRKQAPGGSRGRPGKGGVKPGKTRPGSNRPGSGRPGSTRPGGSRPGGSRPSKPPSAGNRPGGGSSRPGGGSRRPSAGNRGSGSDRAKPSSKGGFSGSSRSGSSARNSSSRGSSSRSKSSAGRSSGSRSASRGGGSRGGGSRGGGGGRGGGGRRR